MFSQKKPFSNASNLAELYGVRTHRLNEAVKRNAELFLETFMFRLTRAEASLIRSQFAISSKRKIKYQPLAFTEHGVAMLSSVLNSPRAIQMSICSRARADRRQQRLGNPSREAGDRPAADLPHHRGAGRRD
jgi:hypothetical protein